MENILLWAGLGIGVLAGLGVLVVVAGSLLPRSHQVGRSLAVAQSPEIVWQTITDFAAVPGWHGQIKKVERLDDRHGQEVWRESYKGNFALSLATTEASAPRRLVRTIADEKSPFTGGWHYELTPVGTGCLVTITERGEVPNPVMRLLAQFLMGPAKYLEMYLAALAGKFGEQPVVRKVA